MKTETFLTAISFVVCLMLSGAGSYYVINMLNQEMKDNVQKQLDSPSYGPFDEAMAEMVGLPRPESPQLDLPESNLPDFSFQNDFSFE